MGDFKTGKAVDGIYCSKQVCMGQKRVLLASTPSSETQGWSLGPEEKARKQFSSTGGKAPKYRLSPDHFQTVKRLLAPDWAEKMLRIIVPNRRTASPEFFS